MPSGPLGGSRPFVKTHMKYDVTVVVPESVYEDPPKAIDVLDIRVTTPQEELVSHVKKQIGEVILAAQGYYKPNRTEVVNEDVRYPERSNLVREGTVHITWTYLMRGSGIGETAETTVFSQAVWKMHEVLQRGNNEPIANSIARREFDAGPLEVDSMRLSTK